MSFTKSENWEWNSWDISWSQSKKSTNFNDLSLLLVHGFGASKEHWRHNQNVLGNHYNCYSIDLLGFGESSQPCALLDYEPHKKNSVKYSFDLWSNQIADFCTEIIKSPSSNRKR